MKIVSSVKMGLENITVQHPGSSAVCVKGEDSIGKIGQILNVKVQYQDERTHLPHRNGLTDSAD
jgi:hypothetical protein